MSERRKTLTITSINTFCSLHNSHSIQIKLMNFPLPSTGVDKIFSNKLSSSHDARSNRIFLEVLNPNLPKLKQDFSSRSCSKLFLIPVLRRTFWKRSKFCSL